MDAYIRRKKWEFKTQAVMIVNAINEAMSGGERKDGTYIAGHREVSADDIFKRIGLE